MRNLIYVFWPCGNDDWADGLVQVEQTCTLAGCNLNRHTCCSSATVPNISVSQVQLQHTLLVVRCNLHRRQLSLCPVNRQVWWFITTLINMCDGKDVWCDGLVAIHSCCLVKLPTGMSADLVQFNLTYIQGHWSSMRKLTRLMPVHQTCQLTVGKTVNWWSATPENS